MPTVLFDSLLVKPSMVLYESDAGPLAHLLTPSWSLPLSGLAGGTVAYLLLRKR